MKIAVCKLKSTSAYSQSRPMAQEKPENETHEEMDLRMWRGRMHVTEDGQVFIPPMSFANSLKEAAKYLSIKIPSGGKATYTKHFEAGVLVSEPLVLPIKAEDVKYERLFVPSDGRRGGGSRVWRHFPIIPSWSGTVSYYVLDDVINEDVFTRVLSAAGQFIGIGRFRPRNCGYYGRYEATEVKWTSA